MRRGRKVGAAPRGRSSIADEQKKLMKKAAAYERNAYNSLMATFGDDSSDSEEFEEESSEGEGESSHSFRLIRSIKNRFGAVNEIGVFAMEEHGLKPVSNPSAIFLSRHDQPVPGSTILVTREGTRPMLVEVQALVDESRLGNPRRVTLGLEQNRLAMLLAVLHRHAHVAMFDQDVFVNIVGGVRISETAADLAVIIACLSSFRDKAIDNDLIAFGEIGLAGEIRPVPNGEERLKEAAKHGLKRAIIPKTNRPRHKIDGLTLHPVQRLHEVLDLI